MYLSHNLNNEVNNHRCMSCNTDIKRGHVSVVHTWSPPDGTSPLDVVFECSGEGIHLHLLMWTKPTSLHCCWCEVALGQAETIHVAHADPL